MTTLKEPDVAKVLTKGRSQVVLLPKGLHLDATEFHVRSAGDALLLTPVRRDWTTRVEAAFGALEALPAMERAPDWH